MGRTYTPEVPASEEDMDENKELSLVTGDPEKSDNFVLFDRLAQSFKKHNGESGDIVKMVLICVTDEQDINIVLPIGQKMNNYEIVGLFETLKSYILNIFD